MAEKDAANEAVLTATRPALQKKQAQAEDLPALLILAQGLYGLNRMNVRQVVVDEAQDVSPLEVRVLRELFRTGCLYAGRRSLSGHLRRRRHPQLGKT